MGKIAILDSGSAGNVLSVANSFRRAGAACEIVKEYRTGAEEYCGLVIPGVGSFSAVPKIMKALCGAEGIARIEIPVLCICLGMQAMLEESEECKGTRGLGIIRGRVRRIRGSVRLPQLGWNRVWRSGNGGECALFDGIQDGEYFYFANSYAAKPERDETVLGCAKYGEKFACAVKEGNWLGVQFHPEKSGSAGQRMIGNFVKMCGAWKK